MNDPVPQTPAPGGFAPRVTVVTASGAWKPGPVHQLVSIGFVVCAGIAIGYGLWAVYGSGAPLAKLEALPVGRGPGSPAALGPIELAPGMNPVRAVLRAAYAPVGSTRIRYSVELLDARGGRVWEREGALGSREDDASIVWVSTSLAVFDVEAPGPHSLRVSWDERGMDDLRQATVELRRNVVRVDARIPWGFGVTAALLLVASIVLSHRRPWPYRVEESPRAAA